MKHKKTFIYLVILGSLGIVGQSAFAMEQALEPRVVITEEKFPIPKFQNSLGDEYAILQARFKPDGTGKVLLLGKDGKMKSVLYRQGKFVNSESANWFTSYKGLTFIDYEGMLKKRLQLNNALTAARAIGFADVIYVRNHGYSARYINAPAGKHFTLRIQ